MLLEGADGAEGDLVIAGEDRRGEFFLFQQLQSPQITSQLETLFSTLHKSRDDLDTPLPKTFAHCVIADIGSFFADVADLGVSQFYQMVHRHFNAGLTLDENGVHHIGQVHFGQQQGRNSRIFDYLIGIIGKSHITAYK